MIARHHLPRWLLAALTLATVQGGCLGACGECNDCGECGLVGGPNTSSELFEGAVGLDGNVPTAEVIPFLEGECAGLDSDRTWVGWANGAVVIRQSEDDEELSVGSVEEVRGTHLFVGAGVTIRVDRSDPTVRITFNPADTDDDVVVECALDPEDRVVCGPP